MTSAMTDLIIVGAGILGLSAAIQAAEQGLTVKVFEKDAQPVGATRRNFGMVGTSTLTRPDSEWRQYALDTQQFYQRIQQQTDISFQQRNGLYVVNTALEWQVINEFSQLAPEFGIPVQLLSATEMERQYSFLQSKVPIRGGLLFAEDYSVEPHLIGQRLLQYALSLGIEIQCNTCVVKTSSQQTSTTAVLSTGQNVQASRILICHGAETDTLYPTVLRELGLKRCTLQMALTQPLAQQLGVSLYSGLSVARYPAFEICPSYQQLYEQSQHGWVRDFGIHILIKQNQNGQIILGDSHEYADIDQPAQFYQREYINQFIEQYCAEKIGLNLPPIQTRWNGYYLQHPTELACVTEVESRIFLISAIAGKGMTTGAGFIRHVLEQHII
ncbi:TIGR03364 family FAD-dependent oxidoreductase [Acinetobacter colistiniresistens]|uniref:TIGR03364 family FAD-dependent oxidoreductase n=1 Tax=Acinetobacter colistiniresistens TaxID=280145 RepID=A0A558F921_9GAMM|nr:TIGR03364 family FAD-dependent oxidoreductase [Acinetobacter colistiniresistens]TVT82114.1 TIGR03364 family FAD-dependent oxidoreductase [Acinetobacter colistiniresistens]